MSPRSRAAAALSAAGLTAALAAGCGAADPSAPSPVSSASDPAASSSPDDATPWVDPVAQHRVRAAVEQGTGARMTTLDAYSASEYAEAMRRQRDTVFGDDVPLETARDASHACLAANREVTDLEAGSGARALAGAGSAGGLDAASPQGYVNLTVTDFPDEASARESWAGHGRVRAACTGQDGWLGVRDAREVPWEGGQAVVFTRRIPGPEGTEVRMRATHVLDGRLQLVLNRRTDGPGTEPEATAEADAAADAALLREVAAALPAD